MDKGEHVFARGGRVFVAPCPVLDILAGKMTTISLADGVSPGDAVRIAAALIRVAIMAWAFSDPCVSPPPAPPPPKPPHGRAR